MTTPDESLATGFEPATPLISEVHQMNPCPAPPAGCYVALEDACGFVLVIVLIVANSDRLNFCYRVEAARFGRNPHRVELDSQLGHLIPRRLELVTEFAAFVHGERHNKVRADVGADHDQVRFTEAGDDLSPSAVPAEVRIAHRGSILHIQFAHDIAF